jgi:hypothetical protein
MCGEGHQRSRGISCGAAATRPKPPAPQLPLSHIFGTFQSYRRLFQSIAGVCATPRWPLGRCQPCIKGVLLRSAAAAAAIKLGLRMLNRGS